MCFDKGARHGQTDSHPALLVVTKASKIFSESPTPGPLSITCISISFDLLICHGCPNLNQRSPIMSGIASFLWKDFCLKSARMVRIVSSAARTSRISAQSIPLLSARFGGLADTLQSMGLISWHYHDPGCQKNLSRESLHP